VNWLFRNRQTGEITVVQPPNAALAVWLVASALKLLFDPSGAVGTALTVAGTGALLVWSADELLRGVNPFRRALGAGVLVWTLLAAISR
jgi:hypothetical protein